MFVAGCVRSDCDLIYEADNGELSPNNDERANVVSAFQEVSVSHVDDETATMYVPAALRDVEKRVS